MRLIHVEDYFDPTAGYQINELLMAKKDINDKIYLITSTDMAPFHKVYNKELDTLFEEKYAITIIRLSVKFRFSNRIVLRNLRKTIEELNPDAVYMHGIADFKDLVLWKKKRQYKIIRDCHMSWVASKNRFNKIFYFIFRVLFAPHINHRDKYDVIYALGIEEKEYLRKLGIIEEKIEFLKHGYNSNIMYYDEEQRLNVRSNYKVSADSVLISYIGKFDFNKRPDIVLQIVNYLGDHFIQSHKIKILMLGPKDTDYMDFFDKQKSNLSNQIEVILDEAKPYYELKNYYSASDICIFPRETSLSSIHAQVCLCSVIMENHASNRERVVNASNLYEIGREAEAAKILKKIIENKEYVKNTNAYCLNVLVEREYTNQVQKLRSRVTLL